MKTPETRLENPDFLEFTYRQLWLAAGAHEEDADAVARAVSLGDRMGKTTQGMGVLDVILFALEAGNLDIRAVPEVVAEGPSWVLYDGHQATGFWTLTMATRQAIEKARAHGIAIAMARNHHDAGSFFAYTSARPRAGYVRHGNQQLGAPGVTLGRNGECAVRRTIQCRFTWG